jgi:hypothetical protein
MEAEQQHLLKNSFGTRWLKDEPSIVTGAFLLYDVNCAFKQKKLFNPITM